MMPFAGFISAYFGPRRTMTIVMLISSLFSFAYTFIITIPKFGYVADPRLPYWDQLPLLTPFIVRPDRTGRPNAISFRFHLGFILRVLLGVVHSPTFPLLQAMWSQWAPIQEKSRLVCCHFVGVPFGSVFIVRVFHAIKFTNDFKIQVFLESRIVTQWKLWLVENWVMHLVGEVCFILLPYSTYFAQYYSLSWFVIHPGSVIWNFLIHRLCQIWTIWYGSSRIHVWIILPIAC